MSVVSINGGSTILVEAFCEHVGTGYRQKLMDYLNLDLRLFRRCLQRTTSSVFGCLEGYPITEFILNRLEGAETRDWISSRSEKGHFDKRFGYASSSGHCGQQHWCVAIERLLFKRKGTQR